MSSPKSDIGSPPTGGAKGLTESAAVEAALSTYLDGGEKDNDLILRRLDRFARDSARQRRDQEVLLEAFAMYVRHWFKYVAECSQAEDLAARVGCAQKSRRRPSNHHPKACQPPHGNPRLSEIPGRSRQSVLPAEDGPAPTRRRARDRDDHETGRAPAARARSRERAPPLGQTQRADVTYRRCEAMKSRTYVGGAGHANGRQDGAPRSP